MLGSDTNAQLHHISAIPWNQITNATLGTELVVLTDRSFLPFPG